MPIARAFRVPVMGSLLLLVFGLTVPGIPRTEEPVPVPQSKRAGNTRGYRINFVALVFFLFATTTAVHVLPTLAQGPSPTPLPATPTGPTPANSPSVSPAIEPKVTGVEGNLELDDLIRVEVDHLKEWAEKNDASKLVPYLNGLAIHGNYPLEIHPSQNHLQFHLQNTAENRKVWIDLLGEPHGIRKQVAFSVGLDHQSPFDTVFDQTHPVLLTVINPPYGLVALVVVLVTLIILVLLSVRTNLVRNGGVSPVPGKLRPYNLGRVQMAERTLSRALQLDPK